MPLTQEQIKDIKYVSMKDFCEKIDEINDINDKLTFASNYLLMHGMVENPDVPIQDAINVARAKILNASVDLYNKMDEEDLDHEEYWEDAVNPYAEEYEDDAELELFVGKPAEYLRGLAFKKYKEMGDPDIELLTDAKKKENYLRQYEMYSQNPKLGNDGFVGEKAKRALKLGDISDDLTRFYGEKAQADQAFERTKPGFFSKMFNTSSIAYNNLAACYKAFYNPNHVDYKNNNALGKAAGEYLQHKFPNWKPGDDFPKDADINKLDATSKERTLFSISILKAIEKGQEREEQISEVLSAHANTQAKFEEVDNLRNNRQQAFQDNINKNLDDSLESEDLDNSDDSISIDSENEMNND